MAPLFNAAEILEIAQEIERNGAEFYRRAAEQTTNPKAHHLLLTLAAMEDEHLEVFASLGEALEQLWDPDFDVDGQAGQYLRAVADGRVFNTKERPAEQLGGSESAEDILRVAIALEKESVVFYQGIRQMVLDPVARDRVDRIIREELGHIADLSRELADLGVDP